MIEARFNAPHPEAPVALFVNGEYHALTMLEALELIRSTASALNKAAEYGCHTRQGTTYGPGNTPTAIPTCARYEIPVAELERYRIDKEGE